MANRTVHNAPRWTADEDAYVMAHYATTPVRQIAEHLGRSYSSVQQRATKHGLKGVHRAGTHSAHHDYFSRIDTPAKAYVLGLLMSDGYVTPLNQVFLSLHADDAAAVEYVRDQVAPGARIGRHRTRNTPMARFSIQSARLAADLARHSVTPAKSHTVVWPSELPEEHAASFVLGLFDGDGSINSDGCEPRWALVSASRSLLASVQARALDQIGLAIGGPYPDRRSLAMSLVTTGRHQVARLDEWTHQSVPGLARKRFANRTN